MPTLMILILTVCGALAAFLVLLLIYPGALGLYQAGQIVLEEAAKGENPRLKNTGLTGEQTEAEAGANRLFGQVRARSSRIRVAQAGKL